ncbi:MAG TPA: choline-sulfatase [Bryobacteraceae bacterium]|nr:choline-sulfatase [Bryobacteraceae bacterium]
MFDSERVDPVVKIWRDWQAIGKLSLMTRRTFLHTPVAAAAQSSLSKPASTSASAPPNILLLMADQMTPFMTGPYGQRAAHTPNLDRLARSGSVFENAYCNSPLCVPSRTSMFTGRLVSKIGAFDNASEFRAEWPTWNHYLRDAGYRTAVAGKCHFIGPDQLHGFDERLTDCIFPASFAMLPDWRRGAYLNPGTSVQAMLRMLGPSKWTRQLAFDEMVFDRAIGRLREYALGKQEQPLFLNVSFTQPHDPFTTTRKFLDLYKDTEIPLPKDHGDIRKLSETYEWFVIHHGINLAHLTPERIREARLNYLAMISWVDDRVGHILDELARLGLDRNTVVIFTSDHGEMLGEHGQWSKRLLLEWSARVPLIVSAPGRLPAGKRIRGLVSLADLFPTFAELAGVKVETQLDGSSLLPLLSGTETGDGREVISEYLGEGSLEPMRMLRQKQYKYIIVNGYPPQLYDLKEDPEETRNVAGQPAYASAEKALRERIERDWDGAALKREVFTSQGRRRVVGSIGQHGQAPHWDYNVVEPGPFKG